MRKQSSGISEATKEARQRAIGKIEYPSIQVKGPLAIMRLMDFTEEQLREELKRRERIQMAKNLIVSLQAQVDNAKKDLQAVEKGDSNE